MRLLLVPLLWSISLAYAADKQVQMNDDMLTIEQLEDAGYVKNWLMQKDHKIDHKSIAYLNQIAKKESAQAMGMLQRKPMEKVHFCIPVRKPF